MDQKALACDDASTLILILYMFMFFLSYNVYMCKYFRLCVRAG